MGRDRRWVEAIEEDEGTPAGRIGEHERGLPRAGVPAAILSGHDLHRLAPIRQIAGRIRGAAPPESCLGRRGAARDPHAGKDRIESGATLPDAEVEHLHLGRSKDLVPCPVGAAVLALSIAMDEIVLVVRSGDIPELPFAVVIDQIRFVDAAMLPLFRGNERGLRLVHPAGAIPFNEADGIWAPDILSAACIVDTLDPLLFAAIEPFDIRRAVPAAVRVPGGACLL